MRTCAPSLASARAVARPIPREAPVTKAVFPERLFMYVSLLSFVSTNSHPDLLGEEHRCVADEALGVLVERTVTGVGVQDQLRARNVLLQDVRVDRVDDDIVMPVDDEGRLRNPLQILVGTLPLHTPFADGRDLRRGDGLVNLRITILHARAEAIQKASAGGLARR